MAPNSPDYEGLQPVLRNGSLRHSDGLQVVANDTGRPYEGMQTIEDNPPEVAYQQMREKPLGMRSPSHRNASQKQSWPGTETTYDPYLSPNPITQGLEKPQADARPRRWWARPRVLIAIGLVIAVLIVVITVPTVLVLKKNNASASPAAGGSSPQNLGPSKSGAFLGTGIGTAGDNETAYIFFQHYDGAIWQSVTSGNATVGPILKSGVKNKTALASASYFVGPEFIKHVVYLNQSNYLQDLIEKNGSGVWQPGTLSAANAVAASSPNVGLAITPQRVLNDSESGDGGWPVGSVAVYYGGTDHVVHELTLSYLGGPWNDTQTFDPTDLRGDEALAAAQLGNWTCVFGSWPDASMGYMRSQTFPGLDVSTGWFPSAPTNDTTNDNSGVATVASTLIYQDDNNAVHAIDMDPSDLNNTWGQEGFIAQAIPGTRLSAFMAGGNIAVLMQTNGSTISQFVQEGTSWQNVQSIQVN